MFPYITVPDISLGFTSISVFNVLVIISICVGCWIVWIRAVNLGVDSTTKMWAIISIVLSGFIVSHLFELLIYNQNITVYSPIEYLLLWDGMSSYGGIIGVLLSTLIALRYLKISKKSQYEFMDCIGFAFPFAWAIGRLGCALSHDHLGIYTNHWLAVQFPDGARLDLGLLEFLYTLVIVFLFAYLGRRQRKPGFYISLVFMLYGPVRFVLDHYRTEDIQYLGLTPGQYGSVLITFIGVYIYFSIMIRNNPEEDNSVKTSVRC